MRRLSDVVGVGLIPGAQPAGHEWSTRDLAGLAGCAWKCVISTSPRGGLLCDLLPSPMSDAAVSRRESAEYSVRRVSRPTSDRALHTNCRAKGGWDFLARSRSLPLFLREYR